MAAQTALEAANALVAALNMRWGELTLQVKSGEVTLIRQGTTIPPDVLAEIPAPGVSSA